MRAVLALLALVALALAGPVPFSWSNCGAATDPVQIKSITVSPSPVQFNANVTGTSRWPIRRGPGDRADASAVSATWTLTEAITDTSASSLVVGAPVSPRSPLCLLTRTRRHQEADRSRLHQRSLPRRRWPQCGLVHLLRSLRSPRH